MRPGKIGQREGKSMSLVGCLAVCRACLMDALQWGRGVSLKAMTEV